MGLRETILQANDLPTKDVYVPEWGQTVTVSALNIVQRNSFELAVRGKPQDEQIASWVAWTIREDGLQVFTLEDVPELMRKSAAALMRVFEVVAELNALSGSDVEEIAGN